MRETEFEVNTRSNGVFRKPPGTQLSANDELRMIYRAGSTNTNAPHDPCAFHGQVKKEVLRRLREPRSRVRIER